MSKAPKTDVETQTEDFDYLIPMRSGYQAPNREFFKSDERVRFYTGLRSYEVLIGMFEQVVPRVSRCNQTLNKFKCLLRC